MNTIITHRKEDTLIIEMQGAFNLRVRNMIESRLRPGITILKIDFKKTTLIDSEAVIFLHRWLDRGHTLELFHPPDLLFEILDILEIRDIWETEKFITNKPIQ